MDEWDLNAEGYSVHKSMGDNVGRISLPQHFKYPIEELYKAQAIVYRSGLPGKDPNCYKILKSRFSNMIEETLSQNQMFQVYKDWLDAFRKRGKTNRTSVMSSLDVGLNELHIN